MTTDIGRCDTMMEGVRCAGVATHVFRSTFATRLICDDCALAYRASTGIAMEFTLELEPARRLLIDRLARTRKAYDKLNASIDLNEGAARDFTHGKAVVAALGIASMTTIAMRWWEPLAVFAGWLAANGLIQYNIRRKNVVKQAELEKTYGFPELTL